MVKITSNLTELSLAEYFMVYKLY